VPTRTRALDAQIFGVDVQSGDVRGDAPAYALVVFDGETVDRDVVSRRKLLRLVDDERPDIVATDNMYELAADKDALIRLLRELPVETALVQVTGDERPEPLSRVAKRHGVPYAKDPMDEAEAAARLAARNVGYEVSAFTDTTTVKVSRGRSTGKGGWSEDRYTRRIHGAVRRRTREIEDELEAAGLTYEREVTEKYGGFSSAIFTVEARPGDIPVKTGRSGDVRVEMDRERRDGIEFRPLARRRDHVLVGVDPGTTTAVALVDLDGHVLDTWSTRTADAGSVIEWIVERGRPIVVAADVTPIPESVEQIRRSFDAAGWTPSSDLPIDEKQHRTREEGYDNDHERDALAAALFAYDTHADQFERIARKVPPGEDSGLVTARVVAGEESVETVLQDLEEDDQTEPSTSGPDPAEPSPEQRRIHDLEATVERLEDQISDLEDELASRDARVADLEDELSAARREERREAEERREVARLQRETDRLERERDEARDRADALDEKLEKLKALWKLDHSNFDDVDRDGDLVPVKVIEQFTLDAIEAAEEAYGIAAGDVVWLKDASGAGRRTAERLVDHDPRIVLRSGGISDAADRVLYEADVPVGPAADVTIREVDELAVARESEVEEVLDSWERRAAEREREQTAELVDQVISEHRADREG
jgi:predicted RNase H-like nuclease (RuvC/YqgF family)